MDGIGRWDGDRDGDGERVGGVEGGTKVDARAKGGEREREPGKSARANRTSHSCG